MDVISYNMALIAQQDAKRLRSSLLSVVQAVTAIAQAVEETQEAISAMETRQFIRPETRERMAVAHASLVEALKELLGDEGAGNEQS